MSPVIILLLARQKYKLISINDANFSTEVACFNFAYHLDWLFLKRYFIIINYTTWYNEVTIIILVFVFITVVDVVKSVNVFIMNWQTVSAVTSLWDNYILRGHNLVTYTLQHLQK